MKKTLGVVAAATLAAMPVMGVFAKGADTGSSSYTDHLVVNVNASCTFARLSGSEHTDGAEHGINGQSAAATGTWENEDDTLTGILAGDDYQSNFGASSFHVICNNAGGWNVTATPADLKKTGETRKIAYTAGIAAAKGTDAWSFTPAIISPTSDAAKRIAVGGVNPTGTSEYVAMNGTDKTTGNDGVKFKVTYAVSTSADLPTGQYTGDVTYTFAQAD